MKTIKSLMKVFVAAAVICASATASACWYNRINYNNYIYGANNPFAQHVYVTSVTNEIPHDSSTEINVKNNQTVDLPLTVVCKLESAEQRRLVDDDPSTILTLRGMLQYRVLPSGNWITVEEFKCQTGTIPANSLPGTYFNKNNIMPRNLKKGDVIMIRIYLTDGQWQSGDPFSLCDVQLTNEKPNANTKTLPDEFTYTPGNISSLIGAGIDLGGMWAPQYVQTVIFSGNYRPIH